MKTRYPQRIDGCPFLPSPSDEPIKKRENKIIVIKNINNQKQTSEEVSTIASEILRSDNVTEDEKSVAGSVISQTGSYKQTGEKIESVASEILRNPLSDDNAKSVAGSALSQSNKERREL